MYTVTCMKRGKTRGTPEAVPSAFASDCSRFNRLSGLDIELCTMTYEESAAKLLLEDKYRP